MSVDLTCPNCQAVYEDQDDSVLGSEVKCQCGNVFIAVDTRQSGGTTSAPAVRRKRAKPKPAMAQATPTTEMPVSSSKPRTMRTRKKSGGMMVMLLMFAVLGGATAFGLLYVGGYFDPAAQEEPGSETIAQSDPSESNPGNDTNPGSETVPERGTSEANAGGNTGRGVTVTDPETEQGPGLTPITSETPQEPSEPESVMPAAGQHAGVLIVEPFDVSNEITAGLHTTIQTELKAQRDAGTALSSGLDQLTVTLAQAGKIAEIQQLQIAKEQALTSGEITPLESIDDEQVQEAGRTWLAAMTESNERLGAAYDEAIELAGDADDLKLQSSLTFERRAGFDVPSDVWTVVFRSSDPRRWNTSFNNGDELARDLSAWPEAVSSLRLRRMDTGACIVVPMSSRLLTRGDTSVPGVRGIGWVGDHRSSGARKLGAFVSTEEFPENDFGRIRISGGLNKRFPGWGFGLIDGRTDLPQGYSWNGESIGTTVIEIALSEVPVEQISPFSLRVNMQLGTGTAAPITLPEDDPIVVELESAKELHAATIEESRQRVLAVFDEELQELGTAGDVAAIQKLAVIRKQFDENNAITEPSNKVGPKLSAFYAEIDRADESLLSAYNKAIASFARDSREDVANVLKEEVENGVGFEAERWVVLFRSPDPRLWNTRSRGQYRFARPISDAPEDTKYLRMRVIPVRTSRKPPEAVICEVTRDRLGVQSDVDGIGWNGLARQDRNAIHLGIYRLDKMLKFPIPREFKGAVSIWSRGFDAHLGWGFGHLLHIDKAQGYSWAGVTSPTPLQIEIAVTARPLRESEAKVLQRGGPVLP